MASAALPGAVLLVRHAEREDYVAEDKQVWFGGPGKERPWDTPITEYGKAQARAAGKRLRDATGPDGALRVARPTRVFSSPFCRCVQTAVEIARELEIPEVLVEEGLSESMIEAWFRSWAVPGANSTWGGPPHSPLGTPVDGSELRVEALDPARCFRTAAELHAEVSEMVCPKHVSLYRHHPTDVKWGNFETHEHVVERMTRTIRTRHAERPGESSVYVSHSGTTARAAEHLTGRGGSYDVGYCATYVALPVEAAAGVEPERPFAPHAEVWACDQPTRELAARSQQG
eukprot:TRINITY_DN20748_c0_g1_i1.p1 TRINITY_DN20748_c0_g1~~TRINITY_DN20748_c0_g1_i1.p1  ORF type:complete len:311 (+),score=90.88 TRINITY_DN20748_c0_g1_i1:73-933(+)